MENKDSSGQILIEFIFMFALLMSILLTIEKMIQTKNLQSNKYKLSTEVKNELQYQPKN